MLATPKNFVFADNLEEAVKKFKMINTPIEFVLYTHFEKSWDTYYYWAFVFEWSTWEQSVANIFFAPNSNVVPRQVPNENIGYSIWCQSSNVIDLDAVIEVQGYKPIAFDI